MDNERYTAYNSAIRVLYSRYKRGDHINIKKVATSHQLNRNTLKKHWTNFIKRGETLLVSIDHSNGRKQYLSKLATQKLRLYVLALEQLNISVSKDGDCGMGAAMYLFKKNECTGDSSTIKPPTPPTVRKYIQLINLKLRSTRPGIQARSSKATKEFIGGFFDVLLKTRNTYNFQPEDM